MTQKSPDKLYFGAAVDSAISEYSKEDSNSKKSKIFEKKIYPAFLKLAEYHYHKMPVLKNQEVISECVAFLYEQLHKFNPEKSMRGFPYFNIIAKHFFIQRMKVEKKQAVQEMDYTVSLNAASSATNTDLYAEDFEEQKEKEQFIDIFKKNLPIWRDKFSKLQEKQIVDALILLFENAEDIDIYKKKAIFLYIKEITGMNSKQVAINLAKVKKKFEYLQAKYDRGEF